MKIIDVPQLSDEWFQARAGVPSASEFHRIVTIKGEPSKQAKAYMYQLAGERITGIKSDSYQSQAMIEGLEKESKARLLFEMMKDIEVQQVGFCLEDNEQYGCSPDGLLDSKGLEIKCPKSHTHVGYLLDKEAPIKQYFQQIQGSMLVAGFQYWFFMSFFPGLPELIILVPRDDKFCAKLKVELDIFCEELDGIEKKLRGMI